MKRKIVHIDEEKCDGCGLCVPQCHEGAIRMVDGKAKLVSDNLCDGLGDCLGECPQDAITIVEREADDFDEKAVARHLEKIRDEKPAEAPIPKCPAARLSIPSPAEAPADDPAPAGALPRAEIAGGCPGARMRLMTGNNGTPAASASEAATPGAAESPQSRLGHWPIKLELIPPGAPFLAGADLLLTADCAPASVPSFNENFLPGKAVALACPKLGPQDLFLDKLTAILRAGGPRSIGIIHMEVPCCTALVNIARQAIADSGATAALESIRIGLDGKIQERVAL